MDNSTIDPKLQKIARTALLDGMRLNSAKSGTALIINTESGAIQSLSGLIKQTDGSIIDNDTACGLFSDSGALSAWEPGSIMKPLLMAAAIDTGSVTEKSHYYETGVTRIGERDITNAALFDPQVMTMQDVLSKSLNTGAVHIEKQLGNNKIDAKARQSWYDYLTNHYRFGITTGIEFPTESSGYVRKPEDSPGVELRYAQMSFGIGLTVTPLQMADAYSALANGGSYHVPYIYLNKIPTRQYSKVMSNETSSILQRMLVKAFKYNNPKVDYPEFIIGSKSGSAPSADDDGSYKPVLSNGTYIGFIGKERPKYIVLVRLIEPESNGLASSEARKVWLNIVDQMTKTWE